MYALHIGCCWERRRLAVWSEHGEEREQIVSNPVGETQTKYERLLDDANKHSQERIMNNE